MAGSRGKIEHVLRFEDAWVACLMNILELFGGMTFGRNRISCLYESGSLRNNHYKRRLQTGGCLPAGEDEA